MTHPSQSLPEPVLPEHQLLLDAAPELELSAGFRSKVLSDCAAQHALAQKLYAAKVLAGVIVFGAAVWIVCSMWNQPTVAPPPSEQSPIHHSGSSYSSEPDNGVPQSPTLTPPVSQGFSPDPSVISSDEL